MDNSAFVFDEVIDAYNEETKTLPTNFNEKKTTCKNAKFLYFTWIFNKYYSIINSIIKYQAKQKTFISYSCHK